MTIGIAASLVLGPIPAIITGAAVGGTAKVIEKNVDDEDAKEAFGFVSDCGRDVAIGGATGGLLEVGGSLVGGQVFQNSARAVSAAKAADKVAGKTLGHIASQEIAKGESKEFFVRLAKEGTQEAAKLASYSTAAQIGKETAAVLGRVKEVYDRGSEAYEHEEHKR